MAEAPFDETRAHRWFAIEFNNASWDQLESAGSLTPQQSEQLVHRAHAACYHWLQVGTPLNHLRAECLLATVYASLGYAESAQRHANRCLELSQEFDSDQTAFDRATALGCVALAHACAAESDEAQRYHELALEAAAELSPEDRSVFDQFYSMR